ncbi:MAG: hypothetical protein ABIG43_00975 [Chloroflexota bacterium]
MKILAQLSPLVEQVSIDEAFIDISNLPKSGKTISKELISIFLITMGPIAVPTLAGSLSNASMISKPCLANP